jgi:hypothetical protein
VSKIKWVALVAKLDTAPAVPAGTIAALATIGSSSALSVDTNGCAVPVGHNVRYPKVTAGTTVAFNE